MTLCTQSVFSNVVFAEGEALSVFDIVESDAQPSARWSDLW